MSNLRQSGRIQSAAAWWIVGFIALVDTAWISLSDFRVDFLGSSSALIGILASISLLWFYRFYRYDERIAATVSGVFLLITFTAVAAPLSYLAASLNRPLWDTALYKWDEALGLDWRAYLAWVNERPLVGTSFKIAYESLIPQMILACLVLGFTGRLFELRCFTLAVIISGMLCVVISGSMPATAMYVHLGLQPTDFPNLSPSAAYIHASHFYGLRDGTLRVLELNAAEGIITFPSYHSALGVIFLAAFWSVSSLRWLGVGLNLTLIAATPIDGGHYFIDIFAGIVIASISLQAAHSLSKHTTRPNISVTMQARAEP